MARILAISSWVAAGHVGLSAAGPVFSLLGHESIQLPTTLLSNHPGFGHVGGRATPPDQLRGMIEALAANGWLSEVDTVLTGYMPSAEHVGVALAALAHAPGARLVCDPILGDAPKGLYVAQAAALAVASALVPRADVLTPNLFELGWLSDSEIPDLAAAVGAARRLAPDAQVLLTSPPYPAGQTGVFEISAAGTHAYRVPVRSGAPHGTGDVFAALTAAGVAPGSALGHLTSLVEASLGQEHLAIISEAPRWRAAPPVQAAA
ncbi:MAG: bifunctional hydroxymethylpyrimidine kinase/phosphomethylpyrimidine kinase [Pseudomonadota bacterium]